MNVLIDTNVVLDVLLDRAPFVGDSSAVWNACDAGKAVGYITATTLTTIYYIVEKTKDRPSALAAVDSCLAAFEIAPVYRETLEAARRLAGKDFEDDVQIAAAVTSFLDAIVTRNTPDFVASPVKVLAPGEFLRLL
jgi:predicted nucleic acid-binding protein